MGGIICCAYPFTRLITHLFLSSWKKHGVAHMANSEVRNTDVMLCYGDRFGFSWRTSCATPQPLHD